VKLVWVFIRQTRTHSRSYCMQRLKIFFFNLRWFLCWIVLRNHFILRSAMFLSDVEEITTSSLTINYEITFVRWIWYLRKPTCCCRNGLDISLFVFCLSWPNILHTWTWRCMICLADGFFGGGLAGGKIRAGDFAWAEKRAGVKKPFSPPARRFPTLIFPPASPPKTVCHAG
jgi:hypothetical protein